MSLTVCLTVTTLYYPEGGGNLWLYLNWALSFKSLGCRVIWLEAVYKDTPVDKLNELVVNLKNRLSPYGLSNDVALWLPVEGPIPAEKLCGCLDIDFASVESDILVNQYYEMSDEVLRKFKRTALLDIDPGQVQVWVKNGVLNIRKHDYYFTIGENIKPSYLKSINATVSWIHIPPCVSLEAWPVIKAAADAPFTTVSHWYSSWDELDGELYANGKKDGFLPFLDLPNHTTKELELCIYLGENSQNERNMLENLGWRVSESNIVTSSAAKYQDYIQKSFGEFSCAKPAYVKMQNAWVSDRTICYLASGKPVVLEDTGPSAFLPHDEGYLRFTDLAGAIKCVEKVALDYDKHCSAARALAEEYFNGRKVTQKLLDRVMN
ncbi:hypothetical protein GCM10023189_16610 [Nibrella saemangeumensis]|uniref:Glycosyltransferase family 1 protein n=1 Tax=Nibrella saemangeumensis TaxID=1084526 RepID=A0ABP8MLM1_9BACT